MKYHTHQSQLHDASRRPPPQPPQPPQPPHQSSAHHSFEPPKLPSPRNHSTNAVRHSYHKQTTPSWPASPPNSLPSPPNVRFQEYAQQPSLRAQSNHLLAESLLAESISRVRTPLYAHEPMNHYILPPPSLHARPSDAPAPLCVQSASYERGSHLQSRSSTANSPRPDSHSSISASITSAYHIYADSLSPRADPRVDHYHNHNHNHNPLLRHQELQHTTRRQSAQSVVSDSSDAVRHHVDPSSSSWPSSRPQHLPKRFLSSDLDADTNGHLSPITSLPYTLTGSHYHPRSPTQTHKPVPLSTSDAAAGGLQGRHLQAEHDASNTCHFPPSSDTVAVAHLDTVAVAHSVPADVKAQNLGTCAVTQHSLQPHRKRLRISRACDECRRRKTRCDIVGAFPGESGHPLTISGAVPPLQPNQEPKGHMFILQPCMNCRRSQVTCSYSKRPLKRGPSKGYIKDLERRLNSLESQIVSGDKVEDEAPQNAQHGATGFATAIASNEPEQTKPKIRTEDRISRLESVLARPTSTKSGHEQTNTLSDASHSNSDSDATHDKSESTGDAESDRSAPTTVANLGVKEANIDVAPPVPGSPATPAVSTDHVAPSSACIKPSASSVPCRSGIKSALSKAKVKKPSHASSRALTTVPDSDVAEIKAKIVASFLHATFPIVSTRSEAESSTSNKSNIARLEDRVLARGLQLLAEPVEMVTAATESATKAQAHATRVASLIGQASSGLGGPRDQLTQHFARSGTEGLRTLRKIVHRLSGQEADLLMLCHLDHLRSGLNNNSALAAAVSKLGSGMHVENDRETYRRRTLLFMLDRWHAVAFGTPHLLQGRLGMERHSFQSMKDALGDVTQSPLGDAVYEILRCAIMLGQLNDLVQNNEGWKGISKSDVEAVIHSATDAGERGTARDEPSDLGSSDESGAALLSTAALRYSLESVVRCYYAVHTLPSAKDAKVEDLHNMFTLAESILVLGTGKTPISLQGKLLKCAIGPHVLGVAGASFFDDVVGA
uniref:C6 finger domain n=1 Tax=Melanopsichium pennsylvanicum 4 TaxID=1398559 RepID=A0A077RCC8_9BASI|nr:c6 finger domain [Melanopsichium pennsylvanicum 4]